nr:hypothetical protein [Gammaproteobacteria bacterium]
MKDLSLALPVAFYYDTKVPVPIPDIIRSLEGLDALTRSLPRFFSELTGITVDGAELRVQKIETGSLKEHMECVLMFLTPEEREKFKTWLQGTKMGTTLRYAACGGVIAAALIMVAGGAIAAYDAFTGANTPTIQAYHNVIINIGSDALSVSQDQARKAIEAALSKEKKASVAAAMKFVAPAGSENGGALYAGEKGAELHVSYEAARDTPVVPDFKVKDQTLAHQNVPLSIRALDRDRDDAGWWVVMPTIAANKRLRMTFAEGVDIAKAMLETDINADVLVVYSQDFSQGVLIPKSVEVQKIY